MNLDQRNDLADELTFHQFCPKCDANTGSLDWCPKCGRKMRGDRKVSPAPVEMVDGLKRGFHARLCAIMPFCHDDGDILGDLFEGGQNEEMEEAE